jgi:dephospho-CoA kinase
MKKYIGLTGTNASGKGEIAAFFQKHGFSYFSLSDLLRKEIRKRGWEENRDNLINTGNDLREKYGADILARRIMQEVGEKAVIDSIRNIKEAEFLKTQENFVFLAVDAPVELRYQRSKKRGRNESASSLAEFIQKEAQELSGSEIQQQLIKCMEMADFLIINDGTLEDLHRKLEKFL